MNPMIERVREHMAVVDSDGVRIGTVDRVEGGRIRIGRRDASHPDDGVHQFIPLISIVSVDEDTVTLDGKADAIREVEESRDADVPDKIEKPSTYFAAPIDVVTDSELSDAQKHDALGTLEQDARQMSEATAEGMAGGEHSNLDEVLDAKAKLASLNEEATHPDDAQTNKLVWMIQAHPFSSLAMALVAGIGVGMAVKR
ncbi:DUF2171 domain-containing protein [Neoroseomonas rubea]|uniref:DUF2171 domain-containing protein n=1 Tax=Neoroseomonas rubea TaxID=2748666 RepID=UPI0018E002EC|nr:DUF2171 domain-containing protein [Roseomonas rubea]